VVCVTLLICSPTALAVIDNADMLYVGPGETYTLGGAHSYNVSVEVAATSILYVTAYNGGANTGYLELFAPMITVAGTINGNGRGYRGATSQGQGEGPGGGSIDGAGGGYGGQGGDSGWGNPGGPTYGTATGPDIQMGSGGGMPGGGAGGNGGGMIRVEAGSLVFEGLITANGNNGLDHSTWDGGGGGSGGGILLKADGAFLYGYLTATGGDGGSDPDRSGGGGGGGGRIKVFYCLLDETCSFSIGGGAGGAGGGSVGPGEAGDQGTFHAARVHEPDIDSIVDVGNDQGRQVRITWNRSCLDDPSEPVPVTHYTIWRRIDEVRVAGESEDHGRLYPPGDWDFILDMPARGESQYNAVVPTLADSNASGMHWSVFFVSGVKDDPFVYYDSAPDSGYSVDNLSPAPPAGFLLTRIGDTNQMVWEESPEEDFAYYTLHRGESEGFLPDETNLVATLIATNYDDDGPILSFYKLAAVDFNGNVSVYALAVPDVTGADDPESFFLSVRVVSPAGDKVAVEFVLPTSEPATLGLYDVAGRLVAAREVGSRSAGRYTADLAGRSNLASGVYFVRLEQGGSAKVARVVVVR
jgi:hypothetical protein